MTFHKRRYTALGQPLSDLLQLALRPRQLVHLFRGYEEVSPAFREKIMLAVTSVNRCRYCSFLHTQLALREGFSAEEVHTLLSGVVEGVDEEEREALLYAQHWADTQGRPDPEARARMIERYGRQRTGAIETAIRAIMLGNYVGNTLDFLLHSLSGGRLAKS